MRLFSHFRPSFWIVQGLAALAFTAPALAQQSAFGPSSLPPDMKPYVETIPGTEIKFEMVPVPGGTFEMGSPSTEAKRSDDEGPVHKVSIAPFWMGKCEVTWDEFDQYAFSLDLKKKAFQEVDLSKQSASEKAADAVTRPTKPYADMTFGHGHNGNPAICMTHHAAMGYTAWISAKMGKGYRLPTEAEWEYACRAGPARAFSFGDDPAKIDEYAWYVDNAQKPMPVGKKKPNPWGLHDMHGNVAEWCLDLYVADIYSKFTKDQPVKGPVVFPTIEEYPYVARGGSYDDDADRLRCAARMASNREWSMQDPNRPLSIWWHTDAHFIGFRLARPYREQENLKGVKSLVVKGKGGH